MSVIAVVGAQWGDEGKGRVVDYLAADADLVIRYGGGNNAGHTVVNPHGHFKLHLIPSGIFYPGTRNLLGNGVVINPPALIGELDGLAAAGFDCANLFIADRAHLVMPWHVLLDQLEERERGAAKLGTTSRGIGPAYVDKVARRGFRVIDLLEPDAFRERPSAPPSPASGALVADYYARRWSRTTSCASLVAEATDDEPIARRYLAAGERLAPHVVDGQAHGRRMRSSAGSGSCSRVSSARCAISTGASTPTSPAPSPIPGGASLGAGCPPCASTGCSGSPRPTPRRWAPARCRPSCSTARAMALRERGAEYGTSTGRPRRCGWYDAVAVRFSVRLAGLLGIALTKLDVLDGFDRIQVCVAYRDPATGQRWETVPASASVYERLEPVYEELPGWQADTPPRAPGTTFRRGAGYVERLEQLAGVPISHVSVGAGA